MTLQPEPNRPGLWTNPDWTPGTPGTFALLIGVSTYDHLDGGSQPAENTYDMGQLAVSAWTAYALFEWLRTAYQYGQVPLAQCWLLLAPTQTERDKIAQAVAATNGPNVLAHELPPTFSNYEKAISFWYNALDRLPQVAAETSRSLFFFSGHGLEIHLREQILLPTDYLELPNTHNRALNIRKMTDAMAKLAVCDQFYFVDACRNTHPDLANLNVEGNGVLTIASGQAVNAACNSAILYATATGMPAHQHNSPLNGYSLFGQALLDGLRSQAGYVPECNPAPCSVQLAPLQRFVGQRYNQLLTDAGWKTKQYIKLGSEPLDLYSVITHVPPPGPVPPLVPVPNSPLEAAVVTPPASVQELQQLNFTTQVEVSLDSDKPGSDPLYRIDTDLSADTVEPMPPTGVNLHRLLGRESVTAFWSNAGLYDLDQKAWLPGNPLELVRVERTDYSAISTGYRLTFRLNAYPTRPWLQFSDGQTSYGIAVPPLRAFGRNTSPVFRLDFTVTVDGHVADLQVNLAHDNPGTLSRVADLWEKYQTVDVATAAELADMALLHQALQSKLNAPFSALVGAIVLLQARRYDLAEGDWLTNLMNWFPELPDAILLRNQWLTQTRAPDANAEMITNLLNLRTRPLPYTGETFSLALLQLARLTENKAGTDQQRAELGTLHRQLRNALQFFRPGGLLAVYAGPPDTFGPESVNAG